MEIKEIIEELEAVVNLWSKAGKPKPKSVIPKDKTEDQWLREIFAYLRVCIKYTFFEQEAQNREQRKLIRELTKRVKELERRRDS